MYILVPVAAAGGVGVPDGGEESAGFLRVQALLLPALPGRCTRRALHADEVRRGASHVILARRAPLAVVRGRLLLALAR